MQVVASLCNDTCDVWNTNLIPSGFQTNSGLIEAQHVSIAVPLLIVGCSVDNRFTHSFTLVTQSIDECRKVLVYLITQELMALKVCMMCNFSLL